jgi:REP element-mobilizing transposase RayT
VHKIKNPLQCKGLTGILNFMARMIGFMATWTTYGTWLQGSKKGYVKNGITFKANPELEKSNKELLKHDEIKIPKSLCIIVKNAILKEAEEIGQKVYAIAVYSNHVHIVVGSIGKSCGYSVGRFKKAATAELRKYGFNENVWTKGFDKRYCYNEWELKNKIKYVQRHEDKNLALCIAEGLFE